ncbi:MAG: hypothetical protein U0670_24245 [Anaerolineae bacterium]
MTAYRVHKGQLPTMPPDLQPIKDALAAGDKKTAQQLIRPLLQAQPTADLWVLAAQACATKEASINCLRRALALDPYHTQANCLLLKVEGVKPAEAIRADEAAAQAAAAASEAARAAHPIIAEDTLRKKQSRAKKPKGRGSCLVRLLLLMLLSTSCTMLTLNLVGVVSGPLSAIGQLMGGPTPIANWEGTPIAEVANAALVVPAAQSKPVQPRAVDVLEPGFLHEYVFQATLNTEVAIYIQFLSTAANNVGRNVAIVNPQGDDVTRHCEQRGVIEGSNNIMYTCPIQEAGTWQVRLLGRANESVGAYFIGFEVLPAY